MKALINEDEVIFLPTTEKKFDALVKTLVKLYKLPNREHAAAVVANRIQHMPPDQATTTFKYLGHCILKNIAFQVAQARASLLHHEQQIQQLVAALTNNPNDMQAMDHLQKAANEGSPLAKQALVKLGICVVADVIDIHAKPSGDTPPAAMAATPEAQ